MYTWRDTSAWAICAAVWLGPFLLNALRGRFRLMHPGTGFFPLFMIYMLIPPLWYRWRGMTALLTAETWAGDEWFLAEPMLVLALTGIFYHLGVRFSGIRLELTDADDARTYLNMPVLRGVATVPLLFVASITVLGALFLCWMISGIIQTLGYYWIYLLFESFQMIPVVVFQKNRQAGFLFTLGVFPLTLRLGTKGAFLYIPLAFIVFYDHNIFRISKFITAALVVMILLTPLAVATYGIGFYRMSTREVQERMQSTTWADSIEIIAHREYAFETFACLYQQRRGGEPLQMGAAFGNEILQNVPSFIYWNKEVRFYSFVERYLPRDARGRETHYARHVLTPFLLDFDVPGCCAGMLLFGFMFGSCYRIARNAALHKQEAWPLLLYAPLMVMAKFFVEGGLAGGLPRSIGLMAGTGITLVLAKLISQPLERPPRR